MRNKGGNMHLRAWF